MYFELPNLERMREQHERMVKVYKEEGVEVHYFEYPERPRSAYGPMIRSISAASASVVIKGGAIIGREAHPFWRRRSRYITKFLVDLGCPIIYTVHGKGVCEIASFTRMCEDLIIASLSTDCNQDGLNQVRPILERAGFSNIVVAHSPGPLDYFYPEAIGWMHTDMWIGPADVGLAVIYPPFCDYETIRWLKSRKFRLIEVPREEQLKYYPCNMVTLEPGKVMMIEGAETTIKALRKEGVDVVEVPYLEVLKYGGGLRCTTAHLIRDRGPTLKEVSERACVVDTLM